MESGYFTIGRFGGAPIRIHWTAPLGAFFFSGFSFLPIVWLAFVLLILIHEIGHAVFVRAFRLQLVSVDVQGIGGVCRYYGRTTPLRSYIIAWGGVLGQLSLLLIALLVGLFVPPGAPAWISLLLHALVWTNLYLMALNLLPIPGFDGSETWKIFGKNGIVAWWRQRSVKERRKKQDVLREMPRFRPFSPDDILENTPTGKTKRPPKDMLN